MSLFGINKSKEKELLYSRKTRNYQYFPVETDNTAGNVFASWHSRGS